MTTTIHAPAPTEPLTTTPLTKNDERDLAIEDSLDPQDWPAFRDLAHRMLDQMLDYQQGVATRPPWQPVPDEVDQQLRTAAPMRGLGTEGAFQAFLDLVLPYPTGNLHPRFWGWVGGTGSPSGMMAELMTASMNAVAGPFNDSAARVEAQVIDWMRTALGFGPDTNGVMTSGGSVANLIGLAAARDAITDTDIPHAGLVQTARAASGSGDLTLYASTEVHASVVKAAQVLGLGRDAVRLVPVDRGFRVRVAEMARAIQDDRARGLRPFAIVGNAGTVNTGATDDLPALARLAREESLWLHVDGAFGALARLSSSHASIVEGLERADSVAFDFHKWMYVPYEAGCVLVRDAQRLRKPFAVPASYLTPFDRGTAAQDDSTNLKSLQLSRGFKALKVWFLIQEHGLERFGRLIARNIAQARYLARRVEETPSLELLAPVPLNVVCFRYRALGHGPEALDALNTEILLRLQEDGLAVPSSTVIEGRFAIRVAICNQRSRCEDFDFLVEQVQRLGAEISRGLR